MPDYPRDWTPLHIAVWRLDAGETARLANSDTVNVKDDHNWTPVHLACASNESFIFGSHQRSRRGWSLVDHHQPRRDLRYRNNADDERIAAMNILNILLQYRPRLGGYDFPTPLHCASNSGWLSHAVALVNSGALVYTGPDCSPLCWVHGGSAGHNRVAEYLRDQLGDVGLAMIDEDHIRAGATRLPGPDGQHQRQPDVPRELPRDPVMRRQLALPLRHRPIALNEYGLCDKCADMTVQNLCSRIGFLHYPSMAVIKRAARAGCSFCGIIDHHLDMYTSWDQHKHSQVIIRLTNGNNNHKGICIDPPTLRVLEFRLSSHCVCPPRDRRSPIGFLSFNHNCFGGCEGVVERINIYGSRERKFTIPAQVLPASEEIHDYSWTIPAETTITQDPLSPAIISTIHEWLHSCRSSHHHCRLASPSFTSGTSPLPDRVIDVGFEEMDGIRLFRGPETHGSYLALSHRWVTGTTPRWVTTQDSLDRRYQWFSLSGFPKTIFDAVRITRALGFRFLWIDSLCIVQDSADDWNVQSAKMASIYANAVITLFADCAKDDEAGFLHWRRSPVERTSTIPLFPVQDARQADGDVEAEPLTLHLRYDIDMALQFLENVDQPSEYAHLADRGWILQERVLSRRILHFGRDQVFWECHEGTFAENGYIVQRRDLRECGTTHDRRFSKLAYSRVLEEAGQPPLAPDEFHNQWVQLVEVYGTLTLTQPKDKLPALSGLARAFHARTDPKNQYVCGLWGADIARYLAWSISTSQPAEDHRVFQARIYGDGSQGGRLEHDASFVHASQLSARPATYRAPSFSWASVDGLIQFHVRYSRAEASTLRLDEVHIGSSDQNGYVDPYGGGDEGFVYIDVTGPLLRAWSLGPFAEDLKSALYPRKAGYTPLYLAEDSENYGLPFGYLLPDTTESETQQRRLLYCLKLSEAYFLVLVPLCGGDWEDGDWQGKIVLPAFRRIGLGVARPMEGFEKEADPFSDARSVTIRLM